jgi:hypothetical protein
MRARLVLGVVAIAAASLLPPSLAHQAAPARPTRQNQIVATHEIAGAADDADVKVSSAWRDDTDARLRARVGAIAIIGAGFAPAPNSRRAARVLLQSRFATSRRYAISARGPPLA